MTLAISCDTIKEMTDLSSVQTAQMIQHDDGFVLPCNLFCVTASGSDALCKVRNPQDEYH